MCWIFYLLSTLYALVSALLIGLLLGLLLLSWPYSVNDRLCFCLCKFDLARNDAQSVLMEFKKAFKAFSLPLQRPSWASYSASSQPSNIKKLKQKKKNKRITKRYTSIASKPIHILEVVCMNSALLAFLYKSRMKVQQVVFVSAFASSS